MVVELRCCCNVEGVEEDVEDQALEAPAAVDVVVADDQFMAVEAGGRVDGGGKADCVMVVG